jgi:uncharacterized protein (DUF3084 family)
LLQADVMAYRDASAATHERVHVLQSELDATRSELSRARRALGERGHGTPDTRRELVQLRTELALASQRLARLEADARDRRTDASLGMTTKLGRMQEQLEELSGHMERVRGLALSLVLALMGLKGVELLYEHAPAVAGVVGVPFGLLGLGALLRFFYLAMGGGRRF